MFRAWPKPVDSMRVVVFYNYILLSPNSIIAIIQLLTDFKDVTLHLFYHQLTLVLVHILVIQYIWQKTLPRLLLP